MKYSVQFSDAIHIMAYIAIFKDTNLLSSEKIAGSINANPVNVRKIMSQLKKSNLIITQSGKAQPRLAKSYLEISLLDIYQSIEGNTRLIHVDPKTNPDCPVGAHIQKALDDQYQRLQRVVETEMAQISLASIITSIVQDDLVSHPENSHLYNDFLN
ncbi:MAG: Rrf2 family transcriptional regulator [Enterococcus sp.]